MTVREPWFSDSPSDPFAKGGDRHGFWWADSAYLAPGLHFRRRRVIAWPFSVNVYTHVQATTASDLTAEQWRQAWMLAAPVVVAANRFVEAEKDGTPALIDDAHFQLLGALTDYKARAANSQARQDS